VAVGVVAAWAGGASKSATERSSILPVTGAKNIYDYTAKKEEDKTGFSITELLGEILFR